MSKDLKIIQQIENKIGLKLKRLEFDDIFRTIKGYAVDEDQHVVGLNLHKLELTDISFTQDLKHLSFLDLSLTWVSDISSLEGLQNLTHLDLSFTQVSDISPLRDLKNLKYLYLRNCQISRLPPDIVEWGLEIKWKIDVEGGIYLEGNPLEMLPVEIVKKGTEAVRAYFKVLADKRAERRALDEVKVLLVGDGGAGKTSLVKRLFGKGFDKNQSQTRGINIKVGLGVVRKRKITIHFWDFGGQEIMHATHQFFFSRRSLYILVLDGRKEEDPEYWLKHIESFGGDSPILVVINKIDENPGFDVNRKFLQDKYRIIKGFNRLSCRSAEGIADFKRQLVARVAEMKHLQTLWPENWFRVKTRLEEMTGDFIGFDQYEEMCRNEGIDSDEARHTLVEFLHDLGVVLHFSDPALKETNVINPHWATEGVYHIVNSRELADSRGLLPRPALSGILDSDRYPRQKHDFIVELMRKFELCYCLDPATILIPDLLAVGEPDFDFDYKSALKFQIHYDFLPRSIMPRFLVKMRRDIRGFRWDVFISYSSTDLDTVKKIVKDLGRRGIRYWWDEEQIEAGDSISRKIAEGLEKSRCVMPCFSCNQIDSGWCRAEYTAILNKVISGRTIQRVTPLILDDLDLEDYPTLLGDYKYERLSDPGGYEKLLRALKRS